jgi:hypothetical protein
VSHIASLPTVKLTTGIFVRSNLADADGECLGSAKPNFVTPPRRLKFRQVVFPHPWQFHVWADSRDLSVGEAEDEEAVK